MLRKFFETVGVIGFCIEIGIYIEAYIPFLGMDSRFWPIWFSIFTILIMASYIVELKLTTHSRSFWHNFTLRNILEALGVLWVNIEIGVFVEQRINSLGNDILFWLFWLTAFAASSMAVYIIAIHCFSNTVATKIATEGVVSAESTQRETLSNL